MEVGFGLFFYCYIFCIIDKNLEGKRNWIIELWVLKYIYMYKEGRERGRGVKRGGKERGGEKKEGGRGGGKERDRKIFVLVLV